MPEDEKVTIEGVDFFGEAIDGLNAISRITGRTVEEVVSDALRTYLKILLEQTKEGKGVEHSVTFVDLIADWDAARAYFEKMGWLSPVQ